MLESIIIHNFCEKIIPVRIFLWVGYSRILPVSYEDRFLEWRVK